MLLRDGSLGSRDLQKGVGLGIAIDDEGPHVSFRERCAQIDGRGGFPDAPLLIRYGDNSSQ